MLEQAKGFESSTPTLATFAGCLDQHQSAQRRHSQTACFIAFSVRASYSRVRSSSPELDILRLPPAYPIGKVGPGKQMMRRTARGEAH